jgi:glycosyltransferase involved in cell wall biosynthesis
MSLPLRRDAHSDTRSGVSAASRVQISIVIPTLNEIERISDGLPDLDWADEVIVADGGSTDGTREMATRLGARVLVVTCRTIAAQRNAAIAVVRNRWVLALDADERVTPALREELDQLCRSTVVGPTVFRVRSRNWHLGGELRYGPWGRDWKVRVFTRDHRFVEKRVHEHVEVTSELGWLTGTLTHRPYRDLPHQVTKIAVYARWACEDLAESDRRVGLWELLVRPSWRFGRDYIVFGGWKDGTNGFIVAVVSAFSVFLKYASLLTRPRRQPTARRVLGLARAQTFGVSGQEKSGSGIRVGP